MMTLMPVSTPHKNTASIAADLPVKPVFARHETFHPRFGWLKKAVDRVSQDPSAFLRKDASVVFGVGKNMVNAIRYWSQAFKLVEETLEGSVRSAHLTELGKTLLGDNGWDPYLENPATLWVLHWLLLKPACIATAWYFLFNLYSHVSFSLEEMIHALIEYKHTVFPTAPAVESSLKKDIHCLIRMYSEISDGKKQVREDSIDSPFTQLGLLQQISHHHYQFHVGAKPTLPADVIVYACLDFAATHTQGRTINISTLLYEEGCPGRIFKLNESSLVDALENIEPKIQELHLTESAGLVQLAFDVEPAVLAMKILNHYYGET